MPRDIGPGLYGVASGSGEEDGVGDVEQVGESDLVSRKVLLLRQDLVVDVELGLELSDQLVEPLLVRCQAEKSR